MTYSNIPTIGKTSYLPSFLNHIDLRFMIIFSVIFACLFMFPALAQSAPVDPTSLLRKIINVLTGDVATLLAVLAVVLVGLAAMFGFWDVRKAGFVIIGIVIVFGAAWIVQVATGRNVSL